MLASIMGLSPAEFFVQLLGIVMLDLMLGGDNAIVIGMACRNLPDNVRTKGIVLGTVGAVLIRVLATTAVVFLLQVRFLMLIGGVVLVVIGCRLLVQEDKHEDVAAASSLMKAVTTVIVADLAMGIDNVLAVAGVAHGHPAMVIIGLAISVPIMVFGSTLTIKIMNRFPSIIYVGAGVILFAAGRLIVDDPSVHHFFENPIIHWGFLALLTIGGLAFGIITNQRRQKTESAHR